MKLAIILPALALAACASAPPPAPRAPVATQVTRTGDKVQIRADSEADRKALLEMARESCGSPAEVLLYTLTKDLVVIIDYKCQPPGWVPPMERPLGGDFKH